MDERVAYVTVRDFRGHEQYKLELGDGVTVITGGNGVGKTSLLEALHMVSRGRSFRAGKEDLARRDGSGGFGVEVGWTSGRVVKVAYDGKLMQFIAEGQAKKKLLKKLKTPVVVLVPDDLHFIYGSGTAHREFFDRWFAQVDEIYDKLLKDYAKALKHRNMLLKQDDVRQEDLKTWDLSVARYGSYLGKRREQALEVVNKDLSEVYARVSGEKANVQVVLPPAKGEEEFLFELAVNEQKDRAVGHTTTGPHRDDFVLLYNGRRVSEAASRGEMKSLVIALKIVEVEMIRQRLGRRPLILFDDVFSELDEKRQATLSKSFADHQMVITAVKAPKGVGGKRVEIGV